MPTRVLLVDDHQILREGVRALLRNEKDILVIGEADDGRTGVKLVGELRPDVVVLDIAMPDLNGVDATVQIKSLYPATQVIILSACTDQRIAARALRAGATGLIPKDSAFEELTLAIRAVVQTKVYVSPQIARDILEQLQGEPNGNSVFHVLSPREREVLQLMAEGKATKEIAFHLGVSVKTIETHRRSLTTKLHLDSVAELTKYAIREGLATL